MENLKHYDKLCKPPITALKTIGAGRMKGKSDINPQWRIKAMTEEFGVCGIGWKYEVTGRRTEPGTDGVIFAFVDINLYIKDGENWSDAIPGSGGSQLVIKESNGMYNNDEAFKMATTDALSVAMKFLGVGGDIYAGLWDGQKYTDEPLKEHKLPELTEDMPAYYNVLQYLEKGGDIKEVEKKYFIADATRKKLLK